MKLGLGTVQFGLSYGISNRRGKPGLDEVNKILESALQHKIKVLDTAADYGDSEEILGKLVPQDSSFQIITKTSKASDARMSIERSLSRLRRQNITGALIHDFEQFRKSPGRWDDFTRAKGEGLVKSIGFSLYSPEQLDFLISKRMDFDIVQVPYNIFDQRFQNKFQVLKERNIQIHTRSVFLQGLVFTNPSALGSFFDPIKPKLTALASVSRKSGKSIESLCLNFVNSNPYIDYIIIGVDSVENLENNVAAIKENLTSTDLEALESLREDNEDMILPFNWKT